MDDYSGASHLSSGRPARSRFTVLDSFADVYYQSRRWQCACRIAGGQCFV